MKKSYAILLTLLASLSSIFAQQAPPIQWQNSAATDTAKIVYHANGDYPDTYETNEIPVQVLPMADGGYMSLSRTSTGTTTYKLIRFDGEGDTVFSKNLPSLPFIEGYNSVGNTYLQMLNFLSIANTADGGFILSGFKVGSTWFSTDAHYLVLLKIDANGNKQWMEEYRTGWYTNINTAELNSYGVVVADDGGYVICATSNGLKGNDKSEDTKGGQDYWILKTDATGLLEWENTIGGSGDDMAKGIIKTSDGGYIVGGTSNSPKSGDKSEDQKGGDFPAYNEDVWLVKLNATGTVVWDKTIGTPGIDRIGFIKATADGGFIFGADTDAGKTGDKTDAGFGGNDIWVLKCNGAGTVEWQKTYGGTLTETVASAFQNADGSYTIGSTSSSGISGNKTKEVGPWVERHWVEPYYWEEFDWWDDGYWVEGYSTSANDYWVFNIDKNGEMVWQHALGGLSYDQLTSVIPSADGGILVAGWSSSVVSGNRTVDNKTAKIFVYNGNIHNMLANDTWLVKLKGCPNFSNITDTFCQGSTYNFNGQQLTRPGIYNAVLTNVDGCDSTVTLDLAMHATTTPIIARNNATLNATGNYTSYQWLLDGTPVSGATDSTLAFTSSGIYSLLTTNANGCSVVSAPFTVFADGSVAQEDAMVIPNPARDYVSIRFRNIIPSFYVSIVSMEGKKVGLYHFTNTSLPRMDVRKLPAGVYLLRLFGSDGAHTSFKMIKGK